MENAFLGTSEFHFLTTNWEKREKKKKKKKKKKIFLGI
jgi:hypothetical protein